MIVMMSVSVDERNSTVRNGMNNTEVHGMRLNACLKALFWQRMSSSVNSRRHQPSDITDIPKRCAEAAWDGVHNGATCFHMNMF